MATKKTTKTADAPKLDARVFKKARVTEKAAITAEKGVYVFDVAVTATKSEIAKAFEKAYKHKPVKVNLIVGKPQSFFKKGKLGFGPKTKKAYVHLPKGVTVEVL